MDVPPRKSSIFIRQNSKTSAALNRRGRSDEEFSSYGDAYRRAALALFKEHFTPKTSDDHDALPICFMYRHAAELYLKGIARLGNQLLMIHGKPEVTIRRTHRLTLLMDDVRPIFDFLDHPWDVEHRGQPSLQEVRRCLADLERDDALGIDDSQADVWRYPSPFPRFSAVIPFPP
jgi:hypothetical protein